ncbi:DUF3784 domain-containing protein [Candidatus Contubernalis alkaliaceticus]|uniref:DUF3784 domain-containing protein n=1 Tax=Candidatus Contubernalis alkaliaceticus TaxID=338645 RepID=UPI001F4C0839|nr:DUF3784 domain-containing protein [Candidatus Contubernalis alkalaceticus]UNC92211.1 DUF3784 domain-containing protein [Candidatus Contubernalis alkalaceticus]
MIHLLIFISLILLGILIKYTKWTWLIAGYNTSPKKEKEKYDTASLCNGVGNFLFILGAVMLIGSLGEFFNTNWLISVSWILFVLAAIVFLIYANTGNRYMKSDTKDK